MIEQKDAPIKRFQFHSSEVIIHDAFDKDKISVIVPVYNVEKYIGRCLDSIISNDYPELEIICINDVSTDKGLDVLLEYARKDNRIVVIDILQFESKQCTMQELVDTELSLNCWARLYRRSIVSCIRFSVDLELYEDGVFNNEVMWNNREMFAAVIDFPLYYYFIRMNSATHTHDFYPLAAEQ